MESIESITCIRYYVRRDGRGSQKLLQLLMKKMPGKRPELNYFEKFGRLMTGLKFSINVEKFEFIITGHQFSVPLQIMILPLVLMYGCWLSNNMHF